MGMSVSVTSPLLRQARARIARWRRFPGVRAAGPRRIAERRAATGIADVDTDQAAGTVTIALTGDLDITVVPALAEHLGRVISGGALLVIFDMTQVSFADCAAARLVCGQDPSLAIAGRPVIRRPAPLFRTLLALTGLDASCQVES